MKKYLMMGAAALMMGASFTSCSKDKDLFDPEANALKFLQDYQAAFISVFGQPAANQTWGFGDAAASRMTRSENANANEWADPKKDHGGLLVPPPLTPEQTAVVKKYFQITRNIPYQDPGWTNYFIQQVYKGHTNPMTGTDTNTGKPYSPEAYMAANGTTYLYASDYMDHLAAIDGEFVDHINNFNHGDCDDNDHVLDNGGNANDGPFHTDKIMYMKESTTASFGYFNSNGSLCHTEYTGLVSFQTIINALGDEALCLKDGWNRSFMGFDFEQMIEGQCYASDNEQWDYSTNPATFISSTPKELTIWGEYYVNDVKQTNYVYQYNGQPVKLLSDQKNRYCADVITVTDEQLYSEMRDVNNNNAYLGKKLNTDFIDGLLADGYLPIDNKQYREWAKVGGCADGYYSDWIVTLTEAKTSNTPSGPTKKSIRIMAEDVAASAGSDIDFNDVVFDVEATFPAGVETVNTVTITLLAAGGTMPLYIGDVEVHNKLGVSDVRTMINTNAEAYADGVDYFYADNVAPVTFDLAATVSKETFLTDVNNNVVITVNNNDNVVPVLAPQGEPSAKIAVPVGTPWAKEKVNMGDAFSQFRSWVNTTMPDKWYNSWVDGMVIR